MLDEATQRPDENITVMQKVEGAVDVEDEKKITIPEDLFERLVRSRVLEPEVKESNGEDDKVILNSKITHQYLNGFTFSRYLIALKIIMVSSTR